MKCFEDLISCCSSGIQVRRREQTTAHQLLTPFPSPERVRTVAISQLHRVDTVGMNYSEFFTPTRISTIVSYFVPQLNDNSDFSQMDTFEEDPIPFLYHKFNQKNGRLQGMQEPTSMMSSGRSLWSSLQHSLQTRSSEKQSEQRNKGLRSGSLIRQ